VRPDQYVDLPCETLINFRNEYSLSMNLSDEHRVPYYDYHRKFRVALAGDIEKHKSIRHIPFLFSPPARMGVDMSDDMIRLAVAIHADGNFPERCNDNYCRFGLRKARKKERLEMLLNSNGVLFEKKTYESRPTEDNYFFRSPYHGKHFDGQWWQCSSHQLAVIIDELSHWDGLFTTEETRFFTAHKDDADFIQYASHATGRKATMSRKVRPERPEWKDIFCVYIHGLNSRKNDTNIRNTTECVRAPALNGRKYCFTVPTSFFLARHNDCIFITGNSAKTTTSCYKSFRLMMQQTPNRRGIRPTKCIAIRNTYAELLGTTAKDFKSIFGDIGVWKEGSKEPPVFTMRFKVPPTKIVPHPTTVHHEMIFIALDRPDHIRKLRGQQTTWFYLSEAKELPKEIVDMADLRHGRYPSMILGEVLPSWHGMFGDTNQCDEDHWLYRFQEELAPAGKLPDWKFFRQPGGVYKVNGVWVVNPAHENRENLEVQVPRYYERGMQGKSDDWIKVNLANMYGFVMDGKPVHPEYNDSIHCVDDVDWRPDSPIVLSFDFGRTPACAIIQDIGGTWFCLDEFCATSMSASKFAPNLLNYLNQNYKGASFIGWGDPAGQHPGQEVESSAIQILNLHGIPCMPCDTNDTLQRRAAVAQPLTQLGMNGRPRLLICKKAKMIRKGLSGKFCYRRLQVAGDQKFMDVPDKNEWSHPVEALEYGLMGEGEGLMALIEEKATNSYVERRPTPY